MNIAIDTNILSKICYPAPESNKIVVTKFKEIISSGQFRILIPEICVYELKRSLLLNQSLALVLFPSLFPISAG